MRRRQGGSLPLWTRLRGPVSFFLLYVVKTWLPS